MDAVILFSHGSVLCGSGGALLSHAARFRAEMGIEIVEVGYLNYSDPPFTTAVERCAAAGAARIFVVPYFLVPGKFVTIDLPAAIGVARRQYPGIQFVVAEAIGYDEMLADAILESAAKALPQSRWREDLKAASSHCLANPMCPLYGTQDCPKHPVRNTEDIAPLAPIRSEGSTLPTTGKRALLVIAHGSPRAIANADLYCILDVCRERAAFEIVQEAFLECNEPSIPEAIDLCAAACASEIVAVPYFLHTGKHVADDLPTLLEEGHLQHPDVIFNMGEFIGRSVAVTRILEERLRAGKSRL